MINRYFRKLKSKDEADQLALGYYQLLVIHELFNSKYRSILVLKGESAARLAYNIGKGSNKIEFLTLEAIKPKEFIGILKKITRKFDFFRVTTVSEKRYLLKIELEILEDNNEIIPLELEVTKIKYKIKKGVNFDLKILEVPKWNFKSLAQVQLLTEIVSSTSSLSEFNKIRN